MKPGNAIQPHVAIYVNDVQRSMEFYQRLFGMAPAKVRTGYAKFSVADPPLNFTVNEKKGVQQGALSHLGIQLRSTEDVLALRDRWRAAGIETQDEMGTGCCWAMQNKVWATDPDGNQWEAFVVLEDNLPEKSCGDEPCCAPHAG